MAYNDYDSDSDSVVEWLNGESEYEVLANKFKMNFKQITALADCIKIKSNQWVNTFTPARLTTKQKKILFKGGVDLNHLYLNTDELKSIYNKHLKNEELTVENKAVIKSKITEIYGEITQVDDGVIRDIQYYPELLLCCSMSENDLIEVIKDVSPNSDLVYFARCIYKITPNIFEHLVENWTVIGNINLFKGGFIDLSNSKIRAILFNQLYHYFALYWVLSNFEHHTRYPIYEYIEIEDLEWFYNYAVNLYENNYEKLVKLNKENDKHIYTKIDKLKDKKQFEKFDDNTFYKRHEEYAEIIKELSELINEQEKEIERLSNIIKVGQLPILCNHEKRMILSYL